MYFLLGEAGVLLYVGKSSNLRRRLLDHANGSRSFFAEVQDVRWIECRDEDEALCREADIVVALAPRHNAVMVDDVYMFIRVDEGVRGSVRLRITEKADGRVYGGFPHLGKGKSSWRAVRTNAGYSALTRLLWVAFADDPGRIPAKTRGSSPPIDFECAFDPTRKAALHDLFSGRSRRLIDDLQSGVTRASRFMRGPLETDIGLAKEFYRLGAQALRRLRLRHGLRAGPVDKATFVTLMTAETHSAIGTFR